MDADGVACLPNRPDEVRALLRRLSHHEKSGTRVISLQDGCHARCVFRVRAIVERQRGDGLLRGDTGQTADSPFYRNLRWFAHAGDGLQTGPHCSLDVSLNGGVPTAAPYFPVATVATDDLVVQRRSGRMTPGIGRG
jgi:hypothetical protein